MIKNQQIKAAYENIEEKLEESPDITWRELYTLYGAGYSNLNVMRICLNQYIRRYKKSRLNVRSRLRGNRSREDQLRVYEQVRDYAIQNPDATWSEIFANIPRWYGNVRTLRGMLREIAIRNSLPMLTAARKNSVRASRAEMVDDIVCRLRTLIAATPVDTPIPNRSDLIAEYGCPKSAIGIALDVVVESGLLVPIRGAYYVAYHVVGHDRPVCPVCGITRLNSRHEGICYCCQRKKFEKQKILGD